MLEKIALQLINKTEELAIYDDILGSGCHLVFSKEFLHCKETVAESVS